MGSIVKRTNPYKSSTVRLVCIHTSQCIHIESAMHSCIHRSICRVHSHLPSRHPNKAKEYWNAQLLHKLRLLIGKLLRKVNSNRLISRLMVQKLIRIIRISALTLMSSTGTFDLKTPCDVLILTFSFHDYVTEVLCAVL